MKYESVIGLEVHIELNTETKIFCSCSTKFGEKQNTNICPVCMGMPGTLPRLNTAVLKKAIEVGLATNCEISKYIKFDRKNYFYPDNPKNYQISQLYMPICNNGWIDVRNENISKRIRIKEIHMEEDAGKIIHKECENKSFIDFNRAGIPLIEVVTHPDMNSVEEVILYLEKLKSIVQYTGASDCKLEEGSMRVDINLSVREVNLSQIGTRTEIKNLSSFKAIRLVIEKEKNRQIELIKNGGEVVSETRRWSEEEQDSYSMRSKEEKQDYRYFPEPDLPIVILEDKWLNEIRQQQPESYEQKYERYVQTYGLTKVQANFLLKYKRLNNIFERANSICNSPVKLANWLIENGFKILNENNIKFENIKLSSESLAEIIIMLEKREISQNIAKEVFEKVILQDINPRKYIEENKLHMDYGIAEIQDIIKQYLKDNMNVVEDYKKKKEKVGSFIIGQIMRKTKGKAQPEIIKECMEKILQ